MLTFFRSKSNPQKIAAEKLYSSLVAQSRDPVFYAEWGVPDTIDGRFDMIVLHAFVVMRRLGSGGQYEKELSQALYDEMFVDMDRAIREIGIGDLSVKKHIRRMMKAFNGRVNAYELGLGDPVALHDALRRNVYGTVKDENVSTVFMADYLKTAVVSIEAMPLQSIAEGNVIWPLLDARKTA
jgi:cytochrome b pre-mRNA-processing protein 3